MWKPKKSLKLQAPKKLLESCRQRKIWRRKILKAGGAEKKVSAPKNCFAKPRKFVPEPRKCFGAANFFEYDQVGDAVMTLLRGLERWNQKWKGEFWRDSDEEEDKFNEYNYEGPSRIFLSHMRQTMKNEKKKEK